MTNPNYEELLEQIGDAIEANNSVLQSSLETQAYIFNEELTNSQKELFEYVSSYDEVYTEGYATEYVAPLPGTPTNVYPINPSDPNEACLFSYVGVYVNGEGDFSGETPGVSDDFICGTEYDETPLIPEVIERIFDPAPAVAEPPNAVSEPAPAKKTFKDCL